MGSTFRRMMKVCPRDVHAYGACLARETATGAGRAAQTGSAHNVCAKEFAVLKRCFTSARART